VYPAYLDAPATKLALLPEGARFSCGYAPDVVMGFAAPAGLRDIETCDVRAARQALDMWRCVVRTTAAASGGYECQEREGVFMLAFQDAGEAQVVQGLAVWDGSHAQGVGCWVQGTWR
jgi:hypothetical protein